LKNFIPKAYLAAAFSSGCDSIKSKNIRSKTLSIFVSVGTHPQQFNRLLREIDRLISEGRITGNIFCQSGHSDYLPKNFPYKKFVPIDEFRSLLEKCDIFITHAGEGNIGLAKNLGKKFIAIARRKEFSEHTNNHQLELAQVVEQKNLGLVAKSESEILQKIIELEDFSPAKIETGRIVQILDAFTKKQLGEKL